MDLAEKDGTFNDYFLQLVIITLRVDKSRTNAVVTFLKGQELFFYGVSIKLEGKKMFRGNLLRVVKYYR